MSGFSAAAATAAAAAAQSRRAAAAAVRAASVRAALALAAAAESEDEGAAAQEADQLDDYLATLSAECTDVEADYALAQALLADAVRAGTVDDVAVARLRGDVDECARNVALCRTARAQASAKNTAGMWRAWTKDAVAQLAQAHKGSAK